MNTKLYRSESERMIAGVCGGLARYLNINVTLVRLFFVLLALGDGAGVLLYLVLWLVMPAEDRAETTFADNVRTGAREMRDKALGVGEEIGAATSDPERRRNTGVIIGVSLITVGLFTLVDALDIPWLWWLDFDVIWPMLLVIGGVFVLVRALRRR